MMPEKNQAQTDNVLHNLSRKDDFMGKIKICTVGESPALKYASHILNTLGLNISDAADKTITHLLLPIPSFDIHTRNELLQKLPDSAAIIGGNLPPISGHCTYDLLQDPVYVAENAYITAHCAVRILLEQLPTTIRNCPILIIGWGRIGKCLADLLKRMEADVTVAARKYTDRAVLSALGYRTTDIANMQQNTYRVIFNTVPAMVMQATPENCLNIDLASVPGLGGNHVIHARGLPGKYAPEASGKLIADSVIRIIEAEGTL